MCGLRLVSDRDNPLQPIAQNEIDYTVVDRYNPLQPIAHNAGLGTAFFYVLNALFFWVLLKHPTFFCVLFLSFLATYETHKNDAFFS